ncbi:hypothetical protein L2E82_44891 [Cichorium intybus]|uniref:Uncharacterized protein n=1 Tax=Cichorium intybus TaxID=13427 RepID=A0ACB8ZSH4_CICIN|nr:hypothetical protein L2E82_44891 [Cichorium intybus]
MEGGEGRRLSKYDESGEGKERRLELESEPTILSNKYKIEKDEYIRGMDIPERMQLFEESTHPPPTDEMSIEEESIRILHQFRKIKSFQKYGYQALFICKAKALATKHLRSRMIVHPHFQNITGDEAMEMLSEKEPGESIVRPSSRGLSYLTLTIKVYDGVYAHKDIIEGGKENKDIPSMLGLGKTLKIGEDVFEDLDEVMDRYVDPLASHLKTMLGYRKFKHGRKTEVDESLWKEKIQNPSRIVYSFGISHEHPGTFILTYIRSSNLHHEYVGFYPKGFMFRKKMFPEIDRLVAYFQRHITDPRDAWSSVDLERTSPLSFRPGRNDYGAVHGHESGVSRPDGGGVRGR